jgi:oligosaccharide repeat unit polymerase
MGLIPQLSLYTNSALWVAAMLIAAHLAGMSMAMLAAQNGNGKRTATEEIEYRFLYRKALLSVWILVTLVEIIASGGLPIIWVIIGNGRTYEDFGVPSVHGFMNAIYLFLTFSAFIRLVSNRNRASLFEFLLLLSWSVIVVSRALMAIAILQVAVFFLLTSKFSLRVKFGTILTGVVVFVAAFGFLGDIRAEEFSILASTGLSDLDPRFSGLVWVYAYLASPIANLALNVSVDTAELKVVPVTFLLPLLPSFIQRALGYEVGFLGFSGYLAHDAFNVGTAFIQIFIDWGIIGILLYSFVLGMFGQIVWRGFVRTGRADIISLFIPCIVLTIFSNQFNQLPIILLFILFASFTRVAPKQREIK